jgi:hypothetical protein
MNKQEPAGSNQEFKNHANSGRENIAVEFLQFLKHNKKWWLLPIILILLLLGLIILLSGTAIAPFIYPLF